MALAGAGLLAAGLAVAGPAGTGDFDADGRDEILLRERVSGGWGYYDVDDTGAVLHALETPGANGYEFLGVGDFDGDGYADVLLRHPGNLTWRVLEVDTSGLRARDLPTLTTNPDYDFAGIGDFDGDGSDDILIRRNTDFGAGLYYAMGGERPVLHRRFGLTQNLLFEVAGTGDFDGDGRDDVLLRHAERGMWISYEMHAPRATLHRPAVTRNPEFVFQSTGDFTGDGRDDILLRNRRTGEWIYYEMHGARATLRRLSGMHRSAAYRFVAAGDFNADGTSSVSLRHARGEWLHYDLAGTQAHESRYPDMTTDLAWTPAGSLARSHVARFVSVCDRTAAVRDAILAVVGEADCERVTRAQLQSVTWLQLWGRGLSSIKPGDFANLVRLTGLSLSRNAIVEFVPGTFGDLVNLEYLDIEKNAVVAFDANLFAGLQNLRELRIGQSTLVDLPADIFADLWNLETLNIQGSPRLRFSAGQFDALGNLRSLWLPYTNSGQSLPSGLFRELSRLEKLSLCCSALPGLDADTFTGLSSLKHLSLDRNGFPELPDGLFAGLHSLADLRLDDNRLSQIPESVFRLANLRHLELANNRLTEVRPEGFADLAELRFLDFKNNRLTSLPPRAFHGLDNLAELYADGNPGAPFMIALEIERTDSHDPLAPGPAEIAVRFGPDALFTSLPFDVTTDVRVQRGTLSASTTTIPAGQRAGGRMTVTQGTPREGTYVHGLVPRRIDAAGFSGLSSAVAEPVVLFSPESNRLPRAIGRITPHTLTAGVPLALHRKDPECCEIADVTSYFHDEAEGSLKYEARSNRVDVVTAEVAGTRLMLDPVGVGEAVVALTATDSGGLFGLHEIAVSVEPRPDHSRFDIAVVFVSAVSDRHAARVAEAAERWTQLIVGDIEDVDVSSSPITPGCGFDGPIFGGILDDIRMFVHLAPQQPRAGPRLLRASSGLPGTGCVWLQTGSDDGATEAEKDHKWRYVATHEFAHALGFGILWDSHWHPGYPDGDTETSDPHFAGPLAVEAFDRAGGTDYVGPKVPTAGGHWRNTWAAYREGDIVYNEVMSGLGPSWVDRRSIHEVVNGVLSEITVQSMADIGYQVDPGRADPFRITPGPPEASAPATPDPFPAIGLTAPDSGIPSDPHAAGGANDIWRGPLVVIDKRGQRVTHEPTDPQDPR